MNIRRNRHLTLSQRRFLLAVVYAVIALPWIIRGAMHSMGNSANSPLDWVPKDFGARQAYDEFCESFGQGDVVIASWEGCVLGDPRVDRLVEVLRTAKPFQALDGNSYFESVTSGWESFRALTTAPLDLSPDEARARLRGVMVGGDGETTCLIITLRPEANAHRRYLVEKLIEAADHFCEVPRDKLHLAGPVIDGLTVDIASKSTLDHLAVPSAIIVFAVCHLALRSLRAASLVFAVSLYAQGVTLALIHYGGREMSALLIVMPPLIQVLAVAGGIHLMNYYVDGFMSPNIDQPAVHALRSGWLPCVLSAGTTAIGLGSLAISQLSPIRDFGMFAAFGVVFTTAILLFAIPGTLSLWKWQPPRRPRAGGSYGWLNLFRWDLFEAWIASRQFGILIGTFVLMLVAIAGVMSLKASVRIETLFSADSRILQDYAWFEKQLGPLVPIEVVLNCDESCRLSLRDRLTVLQQLEQKLLTAASKRDGTNASQPPRIHSALMSALTFLPEFPAPPYDQVDDPQLRNDLARRYQADVDAQLMALLPQFARLGYLHETNGRQLWRITTYINSLEKIDYGSYLKDLRAAVAPVLSATQRDSLTASLGIPMTGLSVRFTGIMPLVHEIQRQLLDDLFQSFLSAFVVITLVMILLQGGIAAGLISMVSNVFPTLVLFGTMGWLGHDMDIGSVMTASIALGIAVDDTLHYLTFFRRGLQSGLGRREAVRFAYVHCGRAMIQSTVILALGVSVFGLSDFLPTCRFAWMMSASLTTALLGDLVILPALLVSPLGGFFVDYADEVDDEQATSAVSIPMTALATAKQPTPLRVPRRTSFDQHSLDSETGTESQDNTGETRLRFPQAFQDEEYGR